MIKTNRPRVDAAYLQTQLDAVLNFMLTYLELPWLQVQHILDDQRGYVIAMVWENENAQGIPESKRAAWRYIFSQLATSFLYHPYEYVGTIEEKPHKPLLNAATKYGCKATDIMLYFNLDDCPTIKGDILRQYGESMPRTLLHILAECVHGNGLTKHTEEVGKIISLESVRLLSHAFNLAGGIYNKR